MHECATSQKECALLMGTLFLWSNLHLLTPYSGYVDAAAATCESIDAFFLDRSPDTQCTEDIVRSFLEFGWSEVNVHLDKSGCKAEKNCVGQPRQNFATRMILALSNIFNQKVDTYRLRFF
jgi:hypothetical protein